MMHSRYRWPGGEETTVERVVAMLRRAGHDVELHEVENPTSIVSSAAATLAAPWNHNQYRAVRRIIDRFRPDVAHVHNTWFALSPAVIAACDKSAIPVVTTVQNYRTVCPQAHLFRDNRPCVDCVGRFPNPAIRHRCYRGSTTLTAVNITTTRLHARLGTWESLRVVHVPAEFTKRMLVAGPLRDSQFMVFPNAVADLGPRPSPPSKSDEILFAGRLSPEKGLDLVLDAWEPDPPSDLRLTVIGDGPLKDVWESRRLKGVAFSGFQSPERVRQAMLAARALVFPSRWFEVCPMVVVEALSAGLPVFAHDLGATPDLVPQAEALVSPDDPHGWSTVLSALADDATVDRMSKTNRVAYEERHTEPRWLTSHESMYQAALGVERAR